MVVKILIIILLIGFIVIFNQSNKLMEKFDEKIKNATKQNCGMICTKIMDCKGFMVNNNVCYLSKTPILGNPTESKFSDEYDKMSERCNKYGVVTDMTTASDFDKKKNATYICTPNQIDNIQSYYIYDSADVVDEKKISTLEDLKYIEVNDYTFVDIDWTKSIDLKNYPMLIKNDGVEEKNIIKVMTQQNDEYLGQYMFERKCVANTSQSNCMKICLDNDDCEGVEWNPTYTPKLESGVYELHKNVCCPKRQIIKQIPRRNEFSNGHFYLKENKHIDKIKSNIIVDLVKDN